MKKFAAILILATSMLIVFTACGNGNEPYATDDGIRYQFHNLGFSLVFPDSWDGQYGLFEDEFEAEDGTRRFLSIYHRATREALNSNYVGTLFWFGVVPGEHYTDDEPPIMAGATIILAQTGGHTYFLNFPSDVQWDYQNPDSEAAIEYLEMSGQYQLLVDSFRIIE